MSISSARIRREKSGWRLAGGAEGDLFAKIDRLLVERLRAGLWLLLASAVFFAASDIWLAGSQRTPLFIVNAAQIGFIVSALGLLRIAALARRPVWIAMQGDERRCLDAGMDRYVSKPINAQQLSAAIATAVFKPERISGPPSPQP